MPHLSSDEPHFNCSVDACAHRLLIAVPSPVAHWGTWASAAVAPGLWSTGSIIVVRGVLPPPSAAPEQESGVGVVAAPPSLSPWGGAGVQPHEL